MFWYSVSVVVVVVFDVGVGPFTSVVATVLVTVFAVADGNRQEHAVETADFATPLIEDSDVARALISRTPFGYPTVEVSNRLQITRYQQVQVGNFGLTDIVKL